MISGYMEQRTAKRVPLDASMAIVFRRNERELTQGYAIDISNGGLKFMAPQGSLPLINGEDVTFIFDLPGFGLTQASAKVSYIGCLSEQDQGAMSIFGAKFNEMSLNTWNNIVNYCQGFMTVEPSPVATAIPGVGVKRETAQTLLRVEIRLKDGRDYSGQLKDISFGGARVLLREALNLKDSVVLELSFQKKRVRFRASCVWCFPYDDANEQYLAGIYFTNLSADEFSELKSIIEAMDSVDND